MNPIRLWSSKVESIFNVFLNHRKKLLCITGDIDNLGIFVATNGRAKAENFVDIMNHTIGHYLSSVLLYDSFSYIYIPSGEEVIIMFVGNETELEPIRQVFLKENPEGVQSFVRKYLSAHGYPEYLSISFGIKLFSYTDLAEDVTAFIYKDNINEKNAAYLNCMLKIRLILGQELDKQKFFDILSFNPNLNEIYLRNLVYRQMLEYKNTTKEKILQEKFKTEPLRKDVTYGVLNLAGNF